VEVRTKVVWAKVSVVVVGVGVVVVVVVVVGGGGGGGVGVGRCCWSCCCWSWLFCSDSLLQSLHVASNLQVLV